MSNLTQRLLVSCSITAFIFLAIYLSSYPPMRPLFTLMTAALLSVALWEFYHIAKKKGYEPLSSLGIVASIAYLYALYMALDNPSFFLYPWIILFCALIGGFVRLFFKGDRPLSNLALTFFGLAYLTVPLGLIIPINFEFSQGALVYLIVITKLTDTGAYFVGKKLGSIQLAPYISPNKTWEGAIGGFLMGVVASLLLGPWIGLTLLTSLVLGMMLALTSIFGDLTESLLKRDLGVKDSNHLPGLGGFLDVVDSLVFTTPLMYFYLKLSSLPV